MKTINRTARNIPWHYLTLALVLVVCLWAGWHDFDPRIPQEAVRDSIRTGIRQIIQLAVQYFIPINILVFFAQEMVARRRGDKKQDENIQA